MCKLIGPEGRGVPVISTILNITRIHNAISSVAGMRRAIAVARDYAHRREVFGKKLSDQVLHLKTLADMEVEYRAALNFLVQVIILQGKSELKQASAEEETLLRLFVPLLKLYTGKQSVSVSSEGIEALGGTGYMEDSDMPRILRDAQVTSIWEGTTNVLSIDVWRPLGTGAIDTFAKWSDLSLKAIQRPQLQDLVKRVQGGVSILIEFVKSKKEKEVIESQARNFSYSLSRVVMSIFLLGEAEKSGSVVDMEVARRWITQTPLTLDLNLGSASFLSLSRMLALDIDEKTKQPRGTGNTTPQGKPRAKY